MITKWILTVIIAYADTERVWLTEEFATEAECRQWQAFYSEYPFRPKCDLIKQQGT